MFFEGTIYKLKQYVKNKFTDLAVILKEENKALDIENSVLSRMLAEKCTECGYRKEKEDAWN